MTLKLDVTPMGRYQVAATALEECRSQRAQVVPVEGGWRGECGCGWVGPVRGHWLDCGTDTLQHHIDRLGDALA